MSQSKIKRPVSQTHRPSEEKAMKRFSRIIPAAIFIFMLFGLGIALISSGTSVTALIVGGIVGAVIGYFFGHQVAAALAKK